MKVLWTSLAAIAIHASIGLADNENRNILAVTSPAWLANVPTPTQGAVVTQYPKDEDIKTGSLSEGTYPIDLTKYPKPLQLPPTDHPEVQDALKHIDWSKVPKIEPRKIKNYIVDTSGYDSKSDPDCWWTASTCKKPKLSYIPEDIYACPQPGQWGLNYDDGPLRIWSHDEEKKKWQEPRFYNYMVEHGKQKATLFYIGSNVITYPEAAQRALSDGHTICAHTWSHKQMTTLTNEEIVAEMYWTHKAIKEVLGITPKCWRPPYGDVDDRVRSIVWQMGMSTIIWDQDSNDWNLYGTPARGKVAPETIDKHFEDWISKRVNKQDNLHGHITLQHENSNSTVSMAERWLPKVQEAFDVMPIHKCLNDPYPYWEQSWAYPTVDNPSPPLNAQDPNSPQKPGSSSSSHSTQSGQQRSVGSTTVSTTSGAEPYLRTFALYAVMVTLTLGLFA